MSKLFSSFIRIFFLERGWKWSSQDIWKISLKEKLLGLFHFLLFMLIHLISYILNQEVKKKEDDNTEKKKPGN